MHRMIHAVAECPQGEEEGEWHENEQEGLHLPAGRGQRHKRAKPGESEDNRRRIGVASDDEVCLVGIHVGATGDVRLRKHQEDGAHDNCVGKEILPCGSRRSGGQSTMNCGNSEQCRNHPDARRQNRVTDLRRQRQHQEMKRSPDGMIGRFFKMPGQALCISRDSISAVELMIEKLLRHNGADHGDECQNADALPAQARPIHEEQDPNDRQDREPRRAKHRKDRTDQQQTRQSPPSCTSGVKVDGEVHRSDQQEEKYVLRHRVVVEQKRRRIRCQDDGDKERAPAGKPGDQARAHDHNACRQKKVNRIDAEHLGARVREQNPGRNNQRIGRAGIDFLERIFGQSPIALKKTERLVHIVIVVRQGLRIGNVRRERELQNKRCDDDRRNIDRVRTTHMSFVNIGKRRCDLWGCRCVDFVFHPWYRFRGRCEAPFRKLPGAPTAIKLPLIAPAPINRREG